jgi:EmrB/QacA subfamily drug resistance transporter
MAGEGGPGLRTGTAAGRWIVAAAVLGSGVAFLDATVVNVALPAIGRDLGAGLSGLQWVVDGYLLTLGSLLLLGGSLGDIYGRRRIFLAGLGAFCAASLLCGLAPSIGFLVAARALQGVGGALLVPGSLALISSSFRASDRGEAVGAWSALSGVSTAAGPFLGGWLVDAASWRWVFLVNLPLAGVAAWVTLRHVPETRNPAGRRPDWAGAALVTAGLGAVVFALIEATSTGRITPVLAVVGLAGVAALAAFPAVQRRRADPLVPLEIFRNRQFTGANVTTLAVYAAFGGALFLIVVHLQETLGYSALAAGSSLLPVTLLMFMLSTRTARLAQRIGPRLPMTAGPLVVAAGLALGAGIDAGDTYVADVLPAVAVLGLGLALTVAPLTAAVMGAVDERFVGVGSGLNNAVARVGSLLSVALLPLAAGLGGAVPGGEAFSAGIGRALRLAAGLAVAGGVVAFVSVRRAAAVTPLVQPSVAQCCHDPASRQSARSGSP